MDRRLTLTATPVSRRAMLERTACGFGALALAGLLGERAGAADNPLATRPPHFTPRARRIIFLFMQGGPSQVDSFDYKPMLAKRDGQQLPFDDARVIANTGKRATQQRVMMSPWKFRRYGESGQMVSDLFPHLARHVDRLCLIHSMHTEGVAHGPATLFLHCGATNLVRPSIGAWITYGLGSECENLPGFITICPSAGNGGARNYGNAFLPAAFQGTALGRAGAPPERATIRNLANSEYDRAALERQFALNRALSSAQRERHEADAELDAAISTMELAWRMQNHAPGILDLSGESAETFRLYGIGEKDTDSFGRQCLLARRLCEAGVRYIQVTYGDNSANPAWDQHSDLPKHALHARRVDKPIAGLLADLARRGLLEETLVWWGGEFGRTPYAQDNGTGRDHNPGGFTVWLAGAGVRQGMALGETDEFGHLAIHDKVHMHDLHATLLHLLGLDHRRLTFHYSGRDFRLTDVHGRVVDEILEA